MAQHKLTYEIALASVELRERHASTTNAAIAAGIPRPTLQTRLTGAKVWYDLEPFKPKPPRPEEKQAAARGSDPMPSPPPTPEPGPYAIEHEPQIGTVAGAAWELTSLLDNTFRFAAIGDLHAASKYCRWDVREDLIRRAENFGAQCIFDTGNWVDGEASFNRYDLECVGLDAQCRLLAERHPKTKLAIKAVTGADHEGWWCKSMGVDVGRYAQDKMREAGHDWSDLGYMEADIVLRNANSGKASILRVVHPGGGSAYALSYSIQKIIESYEGGEKPAVGLFGHYHKMMAALIRNVWTVQTGCAQDQTPFMRQKRLEAHVGGTLIGLEQNPHDGSIVSMTPQLIRYFNRAYYFQDGKANNRWSGHGSVTPAPRRANTDA